jgi:hypothetical protein
MLRGEGFYRIAYTGAGGGSGFGLLAFETGKVYGVDAMGILYLGDYSLDQITLKATIELTIPPGVWLVTGQRRRLQSGKSPSKSRRRGRAACSLFRRRSVPSTLCSRRSETFPARLQARGLGAG